ncbi:MAG: hypothetical protein ABIO44_11765, partial [Saprospiraceae bacterium]
LVLVVGSAFAKTSDGGDKFLNGIKPDNTCIELLNGYPVPVVYSAFNAKIESNKGNLKLAKMTLVLDDELIFKICYNKCGDPDVANNPTNKKNQPCFRNCWIYFHKI